MKRIAWNRKVIVGRMRVLWPYVLVLPAAFGHFAGHVAETKVAPDETGWIRASATVAILVMQGDFTPSSWRADGDNVYGYCNPQLGKLLFAIPLMYHLMSGTGDLPPLPDPYDFTKSREENAKEKRLPPPYILTELRVVAAFAGVALCGICMRIVQVLCGSAGAFLAGVLLALNPVMVSVSSAVMTDGIYQAFVLLAVLCAMLAYASDEAPKARRRTFWAAIAAGLAGTVKFAAPIILFPYFFLLMMSARATDRLRIPTQCKMILGFGAVFLTVTFALNPFLWPDFSGYDREALGRDWRLLRDGELRVAVDAAKPDWARDLQLKFEDKVIEVDGIKYYAGLTEKGRERLLDHLWVTQLVPFHRSDRFHPSNIVPVLYEITRPLQLPLMYARWYVFKDMLFSGHHWKLPNTETFLEAMLFRATVLPFEWMLAVAGVWVMAWRARYGSVRCRRLYFALLLFVPIAFALVFATRLADIDRYLLLLFALRTIAVAVALQALLLLPLRFFRPKPIGNVGAQP